MPYYTQNQIDSLDKKVKNANKFKRVKWEVVIKNPINKEELKTGSYCSIKDMSNDNPFLPYDTWRNIAVGRSNVYSPFIEINKDLERDKFFCEENILLNNIDNEENKSE